MTECNRISYTIEYNGIYIIREYNFLTSGSFNTTFSPSCSAFNQHSQPITILCPRFPHHFLQYIYLGGGPKLLSPTISCGRLKQNPCQTSESPFSSILATITSQAKHQYCKWHIPIHQLAKFKERAMRRSGVKHTIRIPNRATWTGYRPISVITNLPWLNIPFYL